MNHTDNDILLKFVLEVLDEQEAEQVNNHLEGCKLCSEKFQKFQTQVNKIGNVEMQFGEIILPRLPKRKRYFVQFLRAAAILLLGFLAGYGTSQLSNARSVVVVEQRFQPHVVQVPFTNLNQVDQAVFVAEF